MFLQWTKLISNGKQTWKDHLNISIILPVLPATLHTYHFLSFFIVELGIDSNLFLSLTACLVLAVLPNKIAEDYWKFWSLWPEALETSFSISTILYRCSCFQPPLVKMLRGKGTDCLMLEKKEQGQLVMYTYWMRRLETKCHHIINEPTILY